MAGQAALVSETPIQSNTPRHGGAVAVHDSHRATEEATFPALVEKPVEGQSMHGVRRTSVSTPMRAILGSLLLLVFNRMWPLCMHHH